MNTQHGWLHGYKAHVIVTIGRIILAVVVTNQANDMHQLTPMLDQAQANVALVVRRGGRAWRGGGRCRLLVGRQRGEQAGHV